MEQTLIDFQFEYLHVTVAPSKGQGHANFG